eukprot:gnl/TRDRNA2_/TRDRNA2_129050_c0_seq1.p1 gnl/TRDRNA2_/TRDRNA2_129050_c0~~gnl/TRDRNA2_/TRDRNA2_129050_c0_seq1.p1  ORF type:complete len:177 (-),score=31.04 gnl/TRDRNA2_/TRDRNA2_129050_c0_seq1:102-632(-)
MRVLIFAILVCCASAQAYGRDKLAARRLANKPQGALKSMIGNKTGSSKSASSKGGLIGNKTSSSAKGGLNFPVGRTRRYLRNGRYASRIGAAAPVYMAAVLEYLAVEILELSGNLASDMKKSRISPRHISLAIKNDDELNVLFGKSIIAGGGVVPIQGMTAALKGRNPPALKGSTQ